MITLVLLLALAWQFYLGYSRGLVKQLYLTLSLFVALFVAQANYKGLAAKLAFWVPYTQAVEEKTLTFFPEVSIFEMDRVFYAGLAYLSLALIVYAILRLLSLLLHFFPLDRLDKHHLNLLSGGLSLLVTMVFWSLFFNLLATIPFDQVQNQLEASILVKMVIKFPLLSQLVNQLWVVNMLG